MSHSMMGRNSPIVCPLASLGRASPSLDAQGYHHPLSSSPLDPQAYHQLSREFEDLDREDTPSPLDPHYHLYPRSRNSPFIVEQVYHRPTEQPERPPQQQRKPPDQHYLRQINTTVEKIHSANKTSSPSIHSARSYHLSRSSSSSLDQPYIHTGSNLLDPQVYYSPKGLNRSDQNYVRRSPATFEMSSHSRIANEQIAARNKPRPSINDLEYRLSPNAFQHQGVQYHQRKSSDTSYPMELRSPSLDSVYFDRYPANNNSHRDCQYEASTERAYNYNPDYRLPRNSRKSSSRRTSSPDFDIVETRLVESFSKALRASPNLDQGYHTLVSPSPGPSTPGPWTDSNPNTQTTVILKGKRLVSKCNSFERLPDDVALSIFQWLESFELCQLAQVCKRFESLAWHPRLWSSVTLRGESVGERATRAIAARAGAAVRRLWVRDGCRLGPRALSLVARRCPDLTHLQLQGCATLTPQSLADLTTRCTNLRHLDLTGCSRVSWCSVGEGADSPHPPPRRLPLQYLDMTDCPALSDAGLRAAVRACPQLEYLYLRRCVNITDAGLKFVPAYCSGLKELSVSDCISVTDFGLYELAKLGAALRYLSVAKCTQVSDAGLKAIARRCYKLRYLNARGCEAVSDDSVCVLARAATRLRALDLGKCDVSDSGLQTLAESCPNLKKLSLRNCEMVTDRGVQCIAYYCRGLQQLNIQDCQITVEGYRAVKKYCKRCVIEHTNPGFC